MGESKRLPFLWYGLCERRTKDMLNTRSFAEYRAEILDRLGVRYEAEDIQEFERWRLKVLATLRHLFTREEIAEAVASWITDHPESVVLVPDGSITLAKLDDEVKEAMAEEYKNHLGGYDSNEVGWKTSRIGDKIFAEVALVQNDPVSAVIRKSADETQSFTLGYLTPTKRHILPMPLENGVLAGSVDSYFGVITNASIQNKTTAVYAKLLLDADAGTAGQSVPFLTSLIVSGTRATPRSTPRLEAKAKRSEAIEIARSYYNARMRQHRKFAYGKNFITYAANNTVNDEDGAARLECDTFVFLVMTGIPYESSPYVDDTPNLEYSYDDLVLNPDEHSWCLPWGFNPVVNRKVTYTGAQNWYLWTEDLIYKDDTAVESGDIIIFRRDDKKFFDGITHIGIADRKDNGEIWIFHVTGLGNVPSPMMYEPLSNVIERGGYDIEKNVYYARPNYD